MRARFRIRKHDGRELTPDTLEAFVRLFESGAIAEPDLIYDSLTGEWAPARAHPVYRMAAEGRLAEVELGASSAPPPPESGPEQTNDFGLSLAPLAPEPSPAEAARAFIARMDEERRAEPDRPPELMELALIDGAVHNVVERDPRVLSSERAAPNQRRASSSRPPERVAPGRPPERAAPSREPEPVPPNHPAERAAPNRPRLRRRPRPRSSGERRVTLVVATAAASSLLAVTLTASFRIPEASSLEHGTRSAEPNGSGLPARPPSERETRDRATETTIESARALMSEVGVGAIPAVWLDGRYLANAVEYEDVPDAWRAYLTFVWRLRESEDRLYRAAYLAQLDAERVEGALRSLRLARALSDFAAHAGERREAYLRIEELAVAALSLHDLLVHHTGSISYEPARGSGLSADPVLEAVGTDPESQLLLERTLDRVLDALILDGGGAIEAAGVPQWVKASIEEVLALAVGVE